MRQGRAKEAEGNPFIRVGETACNAVCLAADANRLRCRDFKASPFVVFQKWLAMLPLGQGKSICASAG